MTDSPDRLERELARLGAEYDPPAGWEERVLAAIDEPAARAVETSPVAAPRHRSKARQWWWLAVPAFALAAVAIGFCRPAGTRESTPVVAIAPTTELEVQFVPPGGQRSGDVRGGAVGDTMTVSLRSSAAHQAIWIYRARELVLTCPGATLCVSRFGVTTVSMVIRAPGVYTSVSLSSSAPLPTPQGSLDMDLDRARRANAVVEYVDHPVR